MYVNKTIFVDFDGTIVDVFPRYYGILLSYIGQFTNKKLDYNMYREKKRSGKKDNSIVKSLLDVEINIENYLKYKRERLESPQWLLKDTIIGDPKDAYKKFRAINYNVVLLTQRSCKSNLIWQVNFLGINDCFDDVVVVKPKQGRNSKAQYIGEKINEKNAIIGDSKVEMEAAKLLNIEYYFVNSGLFNAQYIGVDKLIFQNYNSAADFLSNQNK